MSKKKSQRFLDYEDMVSSIEEKDRAEWENRILDDKELSMADAYLLMVIMQKRWPSGPAEKYKNWPKVTGSDETIINSTDYFVRKYGKPKTVQ